MPTYNLIDEPWIPIVGRERASLRDIFTQPQLGAVGGNAVQKMALHKLLLAIAQSAYTPKDEEDWKALGAAGLAAHCINYLDKWHDSFYLYGPKPFLQMPAIRTAKVQPFGAARPEIATGNTTILTHEQVEDSCDEDQKALLLVQLMGFSLGGKKTDNSIVLTSGYSGKFNDKGKPSTGKAGPSLSHYGLVHSMLIGSTVQETIWLNLFDEQQIAAKPIFTQGIGTAPWEKMPTGEDCCTAKELQQSLMGRLIPLSRFVLFTTEGLHYSEGIQHLDYKDGMQDPTVSVDASAKKIRVLWVDSDKRPWRELTSLLSFLSQQGSHDFECWQLRACIPRALNMTNRLSVWSGGLKVSRNAGEQYVAGQDDLVESQIWLESSIVNQNWFSTLQAEMDFLDKQAKKLYGCVANYFKGLNVQGEKQAGQATSLFWHACENNFPTLIASCGTLTSDLEKRELLRKRCNSLLKSLYNNACPQATARQLQAWAKNRPR